uniref:Uncharacterized protein n=1 Tax=Salix viminalis TaxID=40686 RepID=A0A6N2LHF4_SALVM
MAECVCTPGKYSSRRNSRRKTISDLKQKAQNRPIRTVWMNTRRSRGFETGEYPAELDVYTIIAIQLLVTVAVATAVVSVHSISNFIVHTKVGLAIYIAIIVIPFIVLCPLYYFYQLRPLNYILLGIFTIDLGFLVGLTCAFISGKVILQSAIITFTAMVTLTLYTFWAARRGHDFSFLGPFLSASLIALLLFALIQIFFPWVGFLKGNPTHGKLEASHQLISTTWGNPIFPELMSDVAGELSSTDFQKERKLPSKTYGKILGQSRFSVK